MATIVLVHGHMHGAWCWEKIVPLLEGKGHTVVAFDLPARDGDKVAHGTASLEQFVDAASAVVMAQSEPVILVGHSAGGTVLSEIAERMPDRVAKLVYVAAMLLPDGESIFSAFVTKTPMDPALTIEGASAIKTDDVLIRRRFYNTSSDADAASAIAKLCAEPIPPMTHPVRVTAERYGRVKRAFIQTRFDNAVPIDAQAAMCAAMPCDPVIVMDTDHSPFLSAPQEFAAHIDALAG
ncbi:MAG TPA: alpha/beta fold hydrolase [Rhizomicrobium sp.]|nr:alpha/beta fold hydrolase [Rhizomicrobium sp.]